MRERRLRARIHELNRDRLPFVLTELRELDAAIEYNVDCSGHVEGFREVTDSYLRALRDKTLEALKGYRV